ncbi:MAG: serine hydrolase domain-containing protein [Betaproteobacteria bacterium]
MNAPSPTISGNTSPRFAAVREAFARSFADGLELGAALAVVVNGETVVDLWGGHRTLDRSAAWQADTLVNVWSVGKGVMALAIAMLADRGQLDYAAPVARYWPEFAANGKGAITVDQVMSHQAGLDGLNVHLSDEELYGWHPVVNALAAMAPLWPPGSCCVYHPLTYGFLAGELIRRIDGRSAGGFIAEDIAKPLQLDLHIGLAAADDPRAAQMSVGPKAYDWVRQGEKSAYPAAFQNRNLDASAPNQRAWRAAEIPGANAQSDARSLARLYGALARGGELGGVRLLSAQGLAHAVAVRFDGLDACFLAPTVFGAGFRRDAVGFGPHVGPGNFGHTGWGGSVAFADPARSLGFAFVTNHLLGFDDGVDPRRQRVLDAVYQAL